MAGFVFAVRYGASESASVHDIARMAALFGGPNWPKNGLSVAIAREAFAVMGYELVVEFKPWVRSVATATKQERFIGYFPEYYFDSEEFVFFHSLLVVGH
ncbi:hypothetical protein QW180_03185 [Vibrio sinaloensis]|nr:hypothetical protein [Vibrio sinaloensis]